MTYVWLAFVAGTLLVHSHTVMGQTPQSPSGKLDLEGRWVLNGAMSDALPLLPGEAMSLARAAGVVRTGGRPSRAVSGPDPRLVTSVRSALRGSLQAASQLTIVLEGRTITLTDAENQTITLIPNGKRQVIEHGGVRVTIAAAWREPLFTVTREYMDGTMVVDSYATFTAPRQLVLTSTINNKHMAEPPVSVNRVYDPVER